MTPRLSALPSRELAGGLRIATADSHLSRLRGLTGLTGLDADEGLELPRCRSVHTAGMRFPLDHSNVGYLGVMVRNVPLIAFSLVIG